MAGKMIKKKSLFTPPSTPKSFGIHTSFFFCTQNCGDFHDGIKSSCRKCFFVFLIMGYYNFAFHLGDNFDMIVVRLPNQKNNSFVKMLLLLLPPPPRFLPCVWCKTSRTNKKKEKKTTAKLLIFKCTQCLT
jgi:hypothetical protein